MGNKSFFYVFKETPSKYAEYLAGDHWREFSAKIMRLRNYRCEDCKIENYDAYRKYRQKLNVHHKSYERIVCELPEDVELLCHGCHLKRHGLDSWLKFCEKFSMPRISNGSRQICANCGNEYGAVFYNVDESYEGLCDECNRAA